jgi:hypothetical protein
MTSSWDILLSTAYFPPVSYFGFLIKGKNIFIEQSETFPKQTFRNRCEIMTEAGKASLVVPVSKPQGNHTITKNTEICYRQPWNRHHWKTIQSAYRSSPYFSYYEDIIRPLFELKENLLINHNDNIFKVVSGLIGIQIPLIYAEDFEKDPASKIDLRSEISPKKSLVNEDFPQYPQVFSHKFGFLPNLSILDLLFNTGPEARRYLDGVELLNYPANQP